jgi:hypothetical protein
MSFEGFEWIFFLLFAGMVGVGLDCMRIKAGGGLPEGEARNERAKREEGGKR